MASVRVGMQFRTRREVLRGAATLAAGALAACDRLKVPNFDTGDVPPSGLAPITTNDAFYITTYSDTPDVKAGQWQLAFKDAGSRLGSVDYGTLEDLISSGLARDKEHTLECIGGGPTNQAISNAIWTGLPLVELLDHLSITFRADALEMKITGADGYETSIPRSDLDLPLWLVWRMNGDPLPKAHGFPARLLVPGRYGTKNPKWITSIELVDQPFIGFWENYGWSNTAEYKANTYIRAPRESADVQAPVEIVGTAFAGRDEIALVEVSTDGGRTWSPAEITYQNGPDIWTLWRFDWDPDPGDYTVQVRATTVSGARSDPDEQGTDYLAGYDGSMAVRVTVT